MANIEVAAPKTRWLTHNAVAGRNWGVLFIVLMLVLSLIGDGAMVLIATGDDVFRIIPAASLLALTQVWLILSLLFYSKLAFWGTAIFLMTFLTVAAPMAWSGYLPNDWLAVVVPAIALSVVCGVILFRERALFLTERRTRSH